jgi:hypothetical protein
MALVNLGMPRKEEPPDTPDSCPIDGVSLASLSAFLLSPEFKAAFKMWEANT